MLRHVSRGAQEVSRCLKNEEWMAQSGLVLGSGVGREVGMERE